MAGGRSQRLKVERYATDSYGDQRPVPVALPTVAGTNTVGSTLTGTNGTFSGDATITITRSWTRSGQPIAGATGATYVLQAADSGKTIHFHNRASNPIGVGYSSSVGRLIA